MKNKDRYIMLILFSVGLTLRLLILHIFPQPLVADQIQYQALVNYMMDLPFYTHSFRSYGFPMLIVPLYQIFGRSSYISWQIMQTILDSITTVLVFVIAGHIFKSRKKAILSGFLYMINPFTSFYSGVLLTEVTSAFFLMLAFYLFIKFTANGKLLTLAFLALTIGYLPQIRPTFLPFSILLLAIICFRLFNKIVQAKKMIFYMILCVMLFFLPFTYNLIGNFRYHGIWTPFLIDNLLVENLYVSLYLERFFFSEKYFPLPAEVDWIYGLYSAPKKSNEERKKMTEMFLTLSKQKILEDPITFVKIRFKKMWYVWEKHFVFAYQAEGNKWVIGTTYLLNLMLLITGLSGYISEARKKFVVEDERRLFFMLTAVFFVYLTVISSLTSAEERYTIPAYPLVFVFSGSGIYFFLRKIKGYKNGKK